MMPPRRVLSRTNEGTRVALASQAVAIAFRSKSTTQREAFDHAFQRFIEGWLRRRANGRLQIARIKPGDLAKASHIQQGNGALACLD